MSMTANRRPGIRAALCTDEFIARMARLHNDANILCLGERVIGQGLALSIADVVFSTAFEGGRHQRRLDRLESCHGAAPPPRRNGPFPALPAKSVFFSRKPLFASPAASFFPICNP
jgi:hypothetical protein